MITLALFLALIACASVLAYAIWTWKLVRFAEIDAACDIARAESQVQRQADALERIQMSTERIARSLRVPLPHAPAPVVHPEFGKPRKPDDDRPPAA